MKTRTIGRVRVWEIVCALGFVGYMPKAPGTWGSLLAVLLAPILFLPLTIGERILLLVVVFVLGSLMASRVEQESGIKDPGRVVIDELLGQWIVFLPLFQANWILLLTGFVLFRFFDILKPWPVRVSESWLPGGWGIMLDDAVAGCSALVFFWPLVHFWA